MISSVLIYLWLVKLTGEEKDKEYEDEVNKLENKYKIDEDSKRDDKDKKKNDRMKKKEQEKGKLKERGNKITEGDLVKVLEFLDPKSKPSVAAVREMIWDVDEDMDKSVNYDYLEKMYKQCSRDQVWVEPRKLFNLLHFLMRS